MSVNDGWFYGGGCGWKHDAGNDDGNDDDGRNHDCEDAGDDKNRDNCDDDNVDENDTPADDANFFALEAAEKLLTTCGHFFVNACHLTAVVVDSIMLMFPLRRLILARVMQTSLLCRIINGMLPAALHTGISSSTTVM